MSREKKYFAEVKRGKKIIAGGGYHVRTKKFKLMHDMTFSELRKYNREIRRYKDVLKFPILFNETGNVVEFDPNNFSIEDYKDIIQKLDDDYVTRVIPQKQEDRAYMINQFMNRDQDDERSVAPEAK